jgi:uncharacterized protein
MDVPLFPLHTVLSPGLVLPLHIFEARYRLLTRRCLAQHVPFGVVLIREGREVGPAATRVSDVGTLAAIHRARRHPDGRYDLLVIGGGRFRLRDIATDREPYLVADVAPLDEDIGNIDAAGRLSHEVVALFLEYLERYRVLTAATGEDRLPGEPGAVDDATPTGGATDVEPDPRAVSSPDEADAVGDAGAAEPGGQPGADRGGTDAILEVARRIASPDDPVMLSHVLSGLMQVDLAERQALLEVPTAEARLERLRTLLRRELGLLGRGLAPFVPDPSAVRRHN